MIEEIKFVSAGSRVCSQSSAVHQVAVGDDVVNFHLRYPSDPPSAMKKLPGFTANG